MLRGDATACGFAPVRTRATETARPHAVASPPEHYQKPDGPEQPRIASGPSLFCHGFASKNARANPSGVMARCSAVGRSIADSVGSTKGPRSGTVKSPHTAVALL